jgi:hypothetical protein
VARPRSRLNQARRENPAPKFGFKLSPGFRAMWWLMQDQNPCGAKALHVARAVVLVWQWPKWPGPAQTARAGSAREECRRLREQGFSAEAVPLDTTDSASIGQRSGRLGRSTSSTTLPDLISKSFLTYTKEEYEFLMQTNLHGPSV